MPADFTIDLPWAKVGQTVTFTNTSTGAVSYSWDFGDGNTSTATSPTHAYAAEALYTVTLYATDGGGITTSKVETVNINILDTAPAVFYRFESNLDDSSGNGVTASPVNAPTYAAGITGDAMQLSGAIDQYAAIPASSPASFGGDVTVSMWMYRTGAYGAYCILWGDFSAGQRNLYIAVDTPTGTLGANTGTGGASDFGWTFYHPGLVDSFPLNTWTHYCIVRSGTNFLMYVNAVLVTSASIAGFTGGATANEVGIGCTVNYGTGFVNSFPGRIDQCLCFPAALSPTDISDIYNGGAGYSLLSTPYVPPPASFADYLGSPGLSIFPYVTITGLPYVFGNQAPPVEWETSPGSGQVQIGSEIYTWSPTLMTDGGFGSISQKAQPKAGIGFSGDQQFRFQLSGTAGNLADRIWLDILSDSVYRTDKGASIVLETLAPNDTVQIEVDDENPFGAGSIAYLGTETIAYTGVAPRVLTTLTRGRYGSYPINTLGGDAVYEDLTAQGGGGFIATHPLTMTDRVVRLWLAPGIHQDCRFVPYSSVIRGPQDREVYAGIVARIGIDDRLGVVTLSAEDLISELDREVATRLPEGSAGFVDAELTQVDDDNNRLVWGWEKGFFANNNRRMLDGSGTTLANGAYTQAEIIAGLRRTILAGSNPTPLTLVSINLEPLSQHKYKFRMYVRAPVSFDDLFVIDAESGPNFWRELGFTGINTIEPEVVDPGPPILVQYVLDASRERPIFRMPVGSTRDIYLHDTNSVSFDASPGYTRDDTDPAVGAVKIDKDVVCEFSGVTSVPGNRYTILDTSATDLYGSLLEEEIYVPWKGDKTKPKKVTQGLAFRGVGSFRMMLYLMTGGSGVSAFNGLFDQDWWGGSANIDEDVVDSSTFLALNSELMPGIGRDNFAIWKPTTLRKIFQPILQLHQAYIVPTNTTGRFKLEVQRMRPALETESGSAFLLDGDSTNSMSITYDISQDKLINVVEARVGYDNAKAEYRREITHLDTSSVATFGRLEAMRLELRGIADANEASAEIRTLVGNLFRAYAIPYAIIEMLATPSEAWTLQIGDIVKITNPALPLRTGNTRGVVEMVARIYEKVDVYRGQQGFRSKLTMVAVDGGASRYSEWAPCCRGTVAAGGVSSIEDHAFSSSTSSLDVTYFQVGYVVRIYNRGNESTAEIREISSLTVSGGGLSSIGFTVATTLTGQVILEFADYGTASLDSNQRKFGYMSDGDKILQTGLPSGPDSAFRFV